MGRMQRGMPPQRSTWAHVYNQRQPYDSSKVTATAIRPHPGGEWAGVHVHRRPSACPGHCIADRSMYVHLRHTHCLSQCGHRGSRGLEGGSACGIAHTLKSSHASRKWNAGSSDCGSQTSTILSEAKGQKRQQNWASQPEHGAAPAHGRERGGRVQPD